MELLDIFDGVNSDIKRLLTYGTDEQKLEHKVYNAEFVKDGFNGRCAICFEDLKDAKVLMVSEGMTVGAKYRLCTCEKCGLGLIKEYKEDVFDRKKF